MSQNPSQINPHSALAVYALGADELKAMILEHVDSIEECQTKVGQALQELGPEPEELQEELRRSTVFKAAIRHLAQLEDEARYLADHIALGPHLFTASQLLAFRTTWGRMSVDPAKLAFAPRHAEGNEQAERSLARTQTATPRVAIPSAALVSRLGL